MATRRNLPYREIENVIDLKPKITADLRDGYSPQPSLPRNRKSHRIEIKDHGGIVGQDVFSQSRGFSGVGLRGDVDVLEHQRLARQGEVGFRNAADLLFH